MGFKDIIIYHEGKGYKNLDFLKRNKTWIGLVFGLFGMYVWQFSCPGLEGYCTTFGPALTNLGSFLAGAGILDSDYRQKFVQGILKPEDVKKA